MSILKDVLNTPSYRRKFIENQLAFASKDVLKAMSGIAQLESFPIHILSQESVQALVKGVDTAEMAEFVLQMANCTYFSIIAYPKTSTNTFELQTRFQMNNKTRKAYGGRPYKMPNPAKFFETNSCRNNPRNITY